MATTFLPGSVVHGCKIIGRPLAKGANANSYKAESAPGEYIFLKQYKSPSVKVGWYKQYIAYQKEMKRRIESVPQAAHQTYRFLDFFEFEEAPGLFCYCQSFEFASGGCDLAEHLQNPAITWNQRLTFAKLLLMGIRTLHSLEIVHSDLKPENLYLIPDAEIKTGYRFKVIDFDVSLLADVKAPWDGIQGYSGTPGYLSPEHLKGEVPTKASDVFTCGIILAELLCKGGSPFSCDDGEYKEQVLNHRIAPPVLLESTGSPENDCRIEEIIHAALNPDPDERPTAEQIHEVLKGKSAPPGAPRPIPAGSRLILEAENKEKIGFNLSTQVGRSILGRFGEEVKYLSSVQFTLECDGAGWKIAPNASAENRTILNGELLTEPSVLHLNDIIAVGNDARSVIKLPMQVSWEKK